MVHCDEGDPETALFVFTQKNKSTLRHFSSRDSHVVFFSGKA